MITGLNEYDGILIEKDRKGVHNILQLDDENWFIVVTNYDSV